MTLRNVHGDVKPEAVSTRVQLLAFRCLYLGKRQEKQLLLLLVHAQTVVDHCKG